MGPFRTLAFRAPSVWGQAAKCKSDEGLPGADSKNTGDDARLFPVIPGRAEGATPESRPKLSPCTWIPGPALHAVPE